MKLKVIRYKNYGCTMTGPADNESDWENKFYWSFYELNNGNIICLHYTENWEKNKFVDAGYDYSYTKYELKNGKIVTYEFGSAKADDINAISEEFYDWFESLPPYHQVKNNTHPSLSEEECVRSFFEENMEKDKKTNTMSI